MLLAFAPSFSEWTLEVEPPEEDEAEARDTLSEVSIAASQMLRSSRLLRGSSEDESSSVSSSSSSSLAGCSCCCCCLMLSSQVEEDGTNRSQGMSRADGNFFLSGKGLATATSLSGEEVVTQTDLWGRGSSFRYFSIS